MQIEVCKFRSCAWRNKNGVRSFSRSRELLTLIVSSRNKLALIITLEILSSPYFSPLTSFSPKLSSGRNRGAQQQRSSSSSSAADAISADAQDTGLFNSTLQRPLHASRSAKSGADAWQKVLSSLLQLFNFLLFLYSRSDFFF